VKVRCHLAPIDVAASVSVVAVSAVVAFIVHRTLIYCSYGGGPPPPCSHPTDYPLAFRLGIVGVGLVIAGLIVLIRRRRST
jgi:hypothetical protein